MSLPENSIKQDRGIEKSYILHCPPHTYYVKHIAHSIFRHIREQAQETTVAPAWEDFERGRQQAARPTGAWLVGQGIA
jgi:hypothetical protein